MVFVCVEMGDLDHRSEYAAFSVTMLANVRSNPNFLPLIRGGLDLVQLL